MELAFGRALFHRYAATRPRWSSCWRPTSPTCTTGPGSSAAGTRTFTPSTGFPFVVVLVDELAFLTAYQAERDLRKRAEAAIATLTTQGRSVGVCVVAALQDPRKDVISLRNLFPTQIALRLDESDQVDMVLGDGAHDRGALCDEISHCPTPAPGSGTSGWRPAPTRCGSAPRSSPTPTSCAMAARGRLPARRWPEGNRLAHRRALPGLRDRLVLVDDGRPVLT